jgi:hypothetical protein
MSEKSAPPLAPKAQEAVMFPPEQVSTLPFSKRNRQEKILSFGERIPLFIAAFARILNSVKKAEKVV